MSDERPGDARTRGECLRTGQSCVQSAACAEFSDPDNPAHRLAAEHKRLLLDYLARTARQASAADPDGLARQLMLLKEGATVSMQVSGDIAAAARRDSPSFSTAPTTRSRRSLE